MYSALVTVSVKRHSKHILY